MNKSLSIVFASALLSIGLAACETAPKTESGKVEIQDEASTALNNAQRNDSSLRAFLNNSAGYAVFPKVGKGAAGIGGAYGRGVLYEHGTPVGYCDLSQATIGAQLGGQSYTEIIAFENQRSVDHFKESKTQFDAQATAVALKSGSGANAKYRDGVAVFTMNESGLMFEASVGGQKFNYQPM